MAIARIPVTHSSRADVERDLDTFVRMHFKNQTTKHKENRAIVVRGVADHCELGVRYDIVDDTADTVIECTYLACSNARLRFEITSHFNSFWAIQQGHYYLRNQCANGVCYAQKIRGQHIPASADDVRNVLGAEPRHALSWIVSEYELAPQWMLDMVCRNKDISDALDRLTLISMGTLDSLKTLLASQRNRACLQLLQLLDASTSTKHGKPPSDSCGSRGHGASLSDRDSPLPRIHTQSRPPDTLYGSPA
jgi:hypothetical protein